MDIAVRYMYICKNLYDNMLVIICLLVMNEPYPEVEGEEVVFFKETAEVFDFERLVFGENNFDL